MAGIVAIFGVIFLCCLAFWGGWFLHRLRHAAGPPRGPQMLLVFPDVGDGDCLIVRDPVSGHAVLIDTGKDANAAGQILASLHHNGIARLDGIILAQARAASLGGLPDLLASLGTGESVLLPCDPATFAKQGRAARQALDALHQHGLRAWPCQRYLQHFPNPFGAASTIRLTPLPVPSSANTAIASCMAIRIDYGQSSVLYTAALTPQEEQRLVASQLSTGTADLACDVLAVAGGGDKNAASSELLALAAPRVATITCSAEHPPAGDTLQRLHAAGAEVGQTCLLHSFSLRFSRLPELPILWSESPASH